ncbi:GGDEF domain-containing protein [Candidatus Saccharibacteria bacterium]|jgi:diguanylate cyclase (GGDEF)-like protein|nr:GGDEF domain-containing protein [Candidatus Saccharibacteria bacterium]MBP7834687.1 GGDEF domain-containing protein [Candidatus Saccharibacteria bacterium]
MKHNIIRNYISPIRSSERLKNIASHAIRYSSKQLNDGVSISKYLVGKDVLPSDIQYGTSRFVDYASSPQATDKAKLLILSGWFVMKMINGHEDLGPYLKAIGNIGKDPLTHLDDRGTFLEKLEDASKNDSNSALLMIDIMNFKNINNTKGQVAGDFALQSFSSALKQNFRTQRMTDSIHVGPIDNDSTPSRLGGDEFAVILNDGDKLKPEAIDTLCLNKAITLLSSQEVLMTMKKLGLKEFGLRIGGTIIGDDPIKAMSDADHKTKTKVTAKVKRNDQGAYTIYLLQNPKGPYGSFSNIDHTLEDLDTLKNVNNVYIPVASCL